MTRTDARAPLSVKYILSGSLILRQAQDERCVEGLRMSGASLRAQDERFSRCRLAVVLAALLLTPLAASAQDAAAQQPAPGGPMIVQQMHSGFVVAPDFKVTEVDKKTSALAGAYAGWLSDETFFIGGGGYWLANQASDRRMAYGGFVAQWLAHGDRRVTFGAKGLIGGGQATLGDTIIRTIIVPDLPRIDLSRFGIDVDHGLQLPTRTRVRFRENFFVAEPQVDVLVKLSHSLRLTGGIGYRFIDTEGREDNRLSGATATIGLQIGGGS